MAALAWAEVESQVTDIKESQAMSISPPGPESPDLHTSLDASLQTSLLSPLQSYPTGPSVKQKGLFKGLVFIASQLVTQELPLVGCSVSRRFGGHSFCKTCSSCSSVLLPLAPAVSINPT